MAHPLDVEGGSMDLAARLRERELASIRVQLASSESDGLRENVLKSLDERGRAQELVRQQYSGRYPFELLQNANDAARETGTSGRAHFLLTDAALIVADNGSGFGEREVEAICSLGRSSKGPGTAIGHKGLGFKSVGEITDRPQIISRQASFQFDGQRLRKLALELFGSLPAGQRFPVYAFPFPVGNDDLGPDVGEVQSLRDQGLHTIIRLPLREGVSRELVAQHLVDNLLPRLLLFLPGIDHLELAGTDADFSAEVGRDDENGAEHVLLETDSSTEEWLIYRGKSVPDQSLVEPLGEPWTKLETVHYAVAVPLDDASQPRTDETFPLHVYFPTEERPGLNVAVHAEWALSMDRRQIAATPEALPFNRALLRQLVDFVASEVAVDLVSRHGASTAAVESIVPALGAPTQGAGELVRRLWSEALTDTAFLPVADGPLQSPSGIRLLPASLPNPIDAHELAKIDGRHTLRADVEASEAIQAFLTSVSSTGQMSVPEFLAQLRPPTKDTIGAFYRFLINWRAVAGLWLLEELEKVPSVLATNGALLTPGTDPVFFPRQRGDSSIPGDIPVPIAEMPEVKGVEGFLKELGVKPFEWRELIRDFLIKPLSSPDTDPGERARAMAGLRAYHRVRLGGSEDLAPVLGRVLLPVRSADGGTGALRAGAQIYFGCDWTGSEDLERIYGPFGEAEFLDAEVPKDSDNRQSDLDFYRMLGVEDHPRIDEARPSQHYGYMLGSSRHPHRGSLFDEWMAAPEVAAAAICPQGHPQSQQLRLSYRLDRHLELADSQDPVRLMALWNQLAQHWGKVYEPAMEAVFHCINTNHNGSRDRPAESLFAYTLRTRRWVPVDRGQVAELARPEDAWIDATETPRRIKERIPRISEAMYQTRGGAALAAALRLTDAGRPKVRDLLTLLADVATEADATGTSREIDLAARYIQRTLNDVLTEGIDAHPDPDSVRLLASHKGQSMFVSRPPFAEDPMLRDTWEKQRPVLAAETGLGRLTRYLSLTKLDDAVTTSALPYGDHLEDRVFVAVRRKLNSLKPYLLALVRAENPRADGSARRALRRLELVVCDELVLRYEYDGMEVERVDAVCYIATRSEKHGRRTSNIGTAYLELDRETNEPHWFPLGRQLAQHLGVAGLADAVTMLLTARKDDRARMMADRHITPEDIAEAREQVQPTVDDDEPLSNVLDSLLPRDQENGGPSAASQDQSSASTVTTSAPESGSTADDASEETAPAESSTKENKPKAPPQIDYSAVAMVDAQPGSLSPTSTPRHPGSGGGASSAPTIRTEEEKRRIGKRGEEVAWRRERDRLRELGKNPDLAVWVSKTDELSPFDIKSVDEDDQLIYIEVKSTKSGDPGEPFYISRAELVEATFQRSRYYIYRIINVDTVAPTIIRAADPMRLVRDGNGQLLLNNARMTLAFSPMDPVEDAPGSESGF
jgi:hypothetical protein